MGLFAVIVVVVLFSEVLQDRDLDATLLLGLATSAATAALALLGVQALLQRDK